MGKKQDDRNVLNDLLGCSQDIAPAELDDLTNFAPDTSSVTTEHRPPELKKKAIHDKRVLIVENPEAMYLPSLTVCLQGNEEKYRVRTTDSLKDAIVILETGQLADLVVVDLRMPKMEGFKLLAIMNKQYPTVPVIVMSAFSSPEKEENLQSLGTLRLLNNPLDLDELSGVIIAGLELELGDDSLVDLTLSNFLQLIEMEQQTTLLEVISPEGMKCYCFFDSGSLIDALCGEMHGEEAVKEVMLWENVAIDFREPPNGGINRRINKSLSAIFADLMTVSDE